MIAKLMIETLKNHFTSRVEWSVVEQYPEMLTTWLAALAEVESLRDMCLKASASSLGDSPLSNDLRAFAHDFLPVSEPDRVVRDTQLIAEPDPDPAADVADARVGRSIFYVGAELAWLLTVSRCLGLIPYQSLRKLRTSKIRVLGASVAASTVDLLASLGAEDIVCADAGLIDPTNIPRLPMADLWNVGEPKSLELVRRLRRRHPYGSFRAVAENLTPATVDAFLADADVIIEVIDNIPMKSYVQTVALGKKPGTPLIFIADLANQPVVKVVRADSSGHVETPFGRVWTHEEREILEGVQTDPRLIPKAAYLMVKESLPPEQELQFSFNVQGIMPFWSQTPIASRMSAAQAAMAVLKLD